MFPLLILREEIVCLVLLLFLALISRTYRMGKDGRIFNLILTFAVLHVFMDGVTVWTVNHPDSVSPLVNAVSMPADRAAGILLRRAEQHRDRIVFGADAHAMSFFYRVAPVWSLRCGCWILKRSGLELFRDLM